MHAGHSFEEPYRDASRQLIPPLIPTRIVPASPPDAGLIANGVVQGVSGGLLLRDALRMHYAEQSGG